MYTPTDEDISLPEMADGSTAQAASTPAAAAAEEIKTPAPTTPKTMKIEDVVADIEKSIPTPSKAKPAKDTPKWLVAGEEEKAAEPAPTPKPAATAEPAATEDYDFLAGETNYVELEEKIAGFKEKGNNQFRKKAYKEAIKQFSEAVKLFEDNGRPITKGDIKTKITQIYTNRATSLHLLNQQSSVVSDCTFVLEHLDSTNKKALYRRNHAYQV